jgi:GNAT superfamily N-acetyltransferase
MNKDKIFREINKQLAIEYNCSIDDFFKEENIITSLKADVRKRSFKKNNAIEFFSMVTFGKNAVINSADCLHDRLKLYIKNKIGHHLFQYENLFEIDKIVQDYSHRIRGTYHYLLSDKKIEPMGPNIHIKIFEQDEINQFYGKPLFNNYALSKEYHPERPDVLLIIGYDSKKIIGVAGCSADTSVLWQIGVDVDKDYRRRGIGTYLVKLLKNEIEKRNKIPFYCISPSNIYSWNVAINCGFSPAWTETNT